MNRLRWFLSWSYKNANDSRKLRLRRRMLNIHNEHTQHRYRNRVRVLHVENVHQVHNCVTSPERLWWIGEEGEA